MERRGNVISFAEFKRNNVETKPKVQQISAVRADAQKLLAAARKQYDGISDDSPASRIEARDKINFLTRFNRKIARAEPGRRVDLRRTIVDYGYDPEAAAADQSCGLAYVSEADRKETDYHSNVGTVSGLIQRLERSGVQVLTGVRRVLPDDED